MWPQLLEYDAQQNKNHPLNAEKTTKKATTHRKISKRGGGGYKNKKRRYNAKHERWPNKTFYTLEQSNKLTQHSNSPSVG